MQLSARPTPLPPTDDLASALRAAAAARGHGPAVTVLRDGHREEQGFASLLQWTSKGSHWLGIEHGLGPGDRIALVGPPGWLPVAVCLAAWWAGVAVVADGSADVAVVHEHAAAPPDVEEVLSYGAAVDGSPVGAPPQEPYTVAVQTFPDQPPAPRASADAVALVTGDRSWSHAELLAEARGLGDGTLGLDGGSTALSPQLWVPALAVHPLVSGAPTVLLAGAGRDAAAGERVTAWLP